MAMRFLGILILIPSFLYGFSSKEGLALHQKAEGAFHRKDFALAKEYYHELIQKLENHPSFAAKDYVESMLRYAQILLVLEETKQAEEVLTRLLASSPPAEYQHEILLLRARTRQGQEGFMRSYSEMREVDRLLPRAYWSSEAKLYFRAIEITLNERYDEIIKKARRLALVGQLENSLLLYQEVESAIGKGLYPRANHEGSVLRAKIPFLMAKLRYQLAERDKGKIEDQIDCEQLRLCCQLYTSNKKYKEALDQSPLQEEEDVQALYQWAALHYRAKNFPMAQSYFTRVYENAPKESKFALLAHACLVQLTLQAGKHKEAFFLLEELERKNVTDQSVIGKKAYLQGQCAFLLKEYEKAIVYFKQALSLNRMDKESIKLGLASSYILIHQEEKEAEALLRSLLGGSEKSSEALLWLAALSMKEKSHHHVAALLAEEAKQQKEWLSLHASEVIAKARGEAANEVIVLLKPLLQELQRPEKWVQCKEENGIAPIVEECRLLLARAYVKNGKYHLAQRYLFAMIAYYQRCGVDCSRFLALAWQEQGHLAFEKGEMALALECYEDALASGEGVLSEEERMVLWLRQTDCRLHLR